LGLTVDGRPSHNNNQFNANHDSLHSLFNKISSIDKSGVIVIRYINYTKDISTLGEPNLQLRAELQPFLGGTKEQRLRFREYCGDEYISTMTIGRQIYYTIQLHPENHDPMTLRKQTESLAADLRALSNDNSTERKAAITNKYAPYFQNIRFASLGGVTPVAMLLDMSNFFDYLELFSTESEDTATAVAYTTTPYNVPDHISGTRWDAFYDYRPHLDLLNIWHSFDNQLSKRCVYFDTAFNDPELVTDLVRQGRDVFDKDFRILCAEAQRIIASKVDSCKSQEKWDHCFGPREFECKDLATGAQCMEHANQIPYFTALSSTDTFSLDGGSFHSASKLICLPSYALLNPYRADWSGKASTCADTKNGTIKQVTRDHLVTRFSFERQYKPKTQQQCLSSSVEVEHEGVRMGYYDATHGLFGLDGTEFGYSGF
jgi:hypothetical protein